VLRGMLLEQLQKQPVQGARVLRGARGELAAVTRPLQLGVDDLADLRHEVERKLVLPGKKRGQQVLNAEARLELKRAKLARATQIQEDAEEKGRREDRAGTEEGKKRWDRRQNSHLRFLFRRHLLKVDTNTLPRSSIAQLLLHHVLVRTPAVVGIVHKEPPARGRVGNALQLSRGGAARSNKEHSRRDVNFIDLSRACQPLSALT
jgi:hypothetical protein